MLEDGKLTIVKAKRFHYTYSIIARDKRYYVERFYWTAQKAINAGTKRAAREGIVITTISQEDALNLG